MDESMIEYKTSQDWCKEQKYIVMDPDGWDRANFQYSWYEELITEEEFKHRRDRSTLIKTQHLIRL